MTRTWVVVSSDASRFFSIQPEFSSCTSHEVYMRGRRDTSPYTGVDLGILGGGGSTHLIYMDVYLG